MRRHDLHGLCVRSGQAHTPGQLRHGQARQRPHGPAEKTAWRQLQRKSRACRCGPDEDAAPPAAAAALCTRNRARCARLLPDPAVLAGRIGRKRTQHAAPRRGTRSRRAAQSTARARGGASAGGLPGSRRVPPPYARSLFRARAGAATARGRRRCNSGNRGYSGFALLPAIEQRRPLRRRDCGPGSQGHAGDSSICLRPGLPPGNRPVFLRERQTLRGRGGLTHRLLAGRRPCLQRCQSRARGAGETRRALCRSAPGGIPDPGPMGRLRPRPDAGGEHHHGLYP